MPARGLAHCLILTDKLEETKNFYVDVVGLVVGPRPFAPPGYWLYAGDLAVIHLAGFDNPAAGPAVDRTPALSRHPARHMRSVEHIAFKFEGYEDLAARVERLGLQVFERPVNHTREHQFFLTDPNGVGIELNFDLDAIAHGSKFKERNP